MKEKLGNVCGIFFLKIFLCGLILKSLLHLLQYCFCFLMFFGHEACGILAPQPGIEPTPLALEGEVLTTGSREVPVVWLVVLICA